MSPNSLKPAKALKRLPAALTALVLGLTLAACGGDGGTGGDGDQNAQQGGQGGGAFPVTVEHMYGKTTITEEPKRVVTLGLSDQDAVLALGIKPVGAVDWFGERPYGKWPWTNKLWGNDRPTVVGERDEFNIEKILELEPDLVIAQYSGMTKQQYDRISEFTKVVAQPKDYQPYLAPWKVMSRQIGKALGQEDKMNELIKGIEQRFAQIRKDHPEFGKQTIAVADSFEPGVYAAFTSLDPKAAFFKEMGFKLSKQIDNTAEKGMNVAELSAEQLEMLDVDRLVWVTSSEEANDRIRAEPLYQRLQVHQQGRDMFVPYEDPAIGAAFSFNTVLSIPYAIDQMLPRLTGQTG